MPSLSDRERVDAAVAERVVRARRAARADRQDAAAALVGGEDVAARLGQLGLVRHEDVLGGAVRRVRVLLLLVLEAHVVDRAELLDALERRARAHLAATPGTRRLWPPSPITQSSTNALVANGSAAVELSRRAHGSGVPRGLSSE